MSNERITLTLLPQDSEELAGASIFLITAMGVTGTDKSTVSPVEMWPGVDFSMVSLQAKFFADTLEGTLTVQTDQASLALLDLTGHVLKILDGEKVEDGISLPSRVTYQTLTTV